MIFTFEDYGKNYEQLAKEIRQFKLFPLFKNEMGQQIYLAPYIALQKTPEVVIAIGKSKIGYCKRKNSPNKIINQYGDFIVLSKNQMLEVCKYYIQLDEQTKKEFIKHALKK